MNPEQYRVYLEDEAPSVGAGWRSVIARIGYKWVHIKSTGALRGTKIPRKAWDKLRKEKRHEDKAPPQSHSQGSKDTEISVSGR